MGVLRRLAPGHQAEALGQWRDPRALGRRHPRRHRDYLDGLEVRRDDGSDESDVLLARGRLDELDSQCSYLLECRGPDDLGEIHHLDVGSDRVGAPSRTPVRQDRRRDWARLVEPERLGC